jgi:Holliday junction resolvase RusA-like endonuclease
MEPLVEFVVAGEAEPAGSKISEPVRRKGGVIVTKDTPRGPEPVLRTRDDNPKVRGWKDRVAQVALVAFLHGGAHRQLLDGPLEAEFTFYRPRPLGHFGTGRNAGKLKDSAPAFPITRPDALKLARAVEDALSGVVYRDDSQIVDEHLRKRYGEPARCEVRIYEAVPEDEVLELGSVAA